MEDTKQVTTAAEFPTLELDGKTYEVKFTRAKLYRMEKAGVVFNPTFLRNADTPGSWSAKFSEIVDGLRFAIDWGGTLDELSELVFDRRDEILMVLVAAWGKVMLPSLQARNAAIAAQKAQAVQPTIQ